MKFIDAYILARTKRKTRRIRTALVVIVSSLLFSLLFFGAFGVAGIVQTGRQVKDVGFNGRNMASVWPTNGALPDYQKDQQDIEIQMAAELKARGVKVTTTIKQGSEWQTEMFRRLSALWVARSEKANSEFEKHVHELAQPTDVYHFAPLDLSSNAVYQPDPSIDPFVVETEKQEKVGLDGGKGQFLGSGGGEFGFFSAEKDMFRSQVQPGQTLGWQPGKPYPLIISYAYLEKLSGKSFANISAAEKNKSYRDMMRSFAGKELAYCYRNSTAQDQLRQVVHYNRVAAEDKDKTTNPIAVPVCGGFDQKLLKKLDILSDNSDPSTKPLFPVVKIPDPDTRVITFKIAGYVPSVPQYAGSDIVSQILVGVNSLPTSPQMGVVPKEVVDQEPILQPSQNMPQSSTLYVDFATRADQKVLLNKGCTGNECGSPKSTKPYIQPFGSVSFALEGLIKSVSKVVFIAMGVIMVIAALMIMFTISKVISDSTKEIAVFRSLGARRRDIAHIYYTYGLMLAFAAFVLALVLAAIGATVATSMCKDRVANAFIQAVGAYNTDVHGTLFGINGLWIGGIAVALVIAALLGISVPILVSVRRKLITILREE